MKNQNCLKIDLNRNHKSPTADWFKSKLYEVTRSDLNRDFLVIWFKQIPTLCGCIFCTGKRYRSRLYQCESRCDIARETTVVIR